jgi:hypothetical protein
MGYINTIFADIQKFKLVEICQIRYTIFEQYLHKLNKLMI